MTGGFIVTEQGMVIPFGQISSTASMRQAISTLVDYFDQLDQKLLESYLNNLTTEQRKALLNTESNTVEQ